MRRVDRQRFSSNSLDTWSAPRAHFARNRGDQPSDETESRGGDAPLMRGARLHQAGKLLVADESRPVPAAGQELIAVTAVGICGSDLHWFTEGSIGDAVLNAPLILGHEIGGVIASGPRTGQRVAVDPSIPCWICPPCLDGNPNLCINIVFAGHGDTDGGMRQYLAWPSERLHQVAGMPHLDHRRRGDVLRGSRSGPDPAGDGVVGTRTRPPCAHLA